MSHAAGLLQGSAGGRCIAGGRAGSAHIDSTVVHTPPHATAGGCCPFEVLPYVCQVYCLASDALTGLACLCLACRANTTTTLAFSWHTSAFLKTCCQNCSSLWVQSRSATPAAAAAVASTAHSRSPPWHRLPCSLCYALRRMTCLTRPLLMRPQCEFLLGASADSLALLTGISPVWVVGEWWLPSVNRDAEHCNTLFLLYCRAAPAATASMRFLVRLAERLALLSAQQPLSQAQQQVLQDALHLMRDICARDDSGRGMCGGGNLVASLQAAGFLSTFLALLKALGPIQRPPHQQQAAAAAPPAAQDGSGIPVAELAPALAQQAKGFPADPPYQGWRTDLLAAVANAAHDRPPVKVGRRKAYAWRTPVSGRFSCCTLNCLRAGVWLCPVVCALYCCSAAALDAPGCRPRCLRWAEWSWCWHSARWTISRRWRGSGHFGVCETCARAMCRRRCGSCAANPLLWLMRCCGECTSVWAIPDTCGS